MDKCGELNFYKEIGKANKKIFKLKNKIKEIKKGGKKPPVELINELRKSLLDKHNYLFLNNVRFGK